MCQNKEPAQIGAPCIRDTMPLPWSPTEPMIQGLPFKCPVMELGASECRLGKGSRWQWRRLYLRTLCDIFPLLSV